MKSNFAKIGALTLIIGMLPALYAAPTLPPDAKYACPMDTHPGETDPAKQGAYFSSEPGKCPWCNMSLKPLDDLPWARALRNAQGAEVAYTCPQHQHVFARGTGECPRCKKELQAFKVLYTCRDPQHAAEIHLKSGDCPRCSQPLVAFRGIWIDESMAGANVPPNTQPAEHARYRCELHPLVHSDSPGACTICAAALVSAGPESTSQPAELADAQTQPGTARYLCPMHPKQVAEKRGTCPICAMQMVSAEHFHMPTSAPARVQRELDHVMEHYLALQSLLASDSTKDVARHALGIAAATEEMLKHVSDLDKKTAEKVTPTVRKIHDAALKINGTRIADDRVQFVDLSSGMLELFEHMRADPQRWPKLFIFHCAMSKGSWLQNTETITNPYYGFQMLRCGELKGTK